WIYRLYLLFIDAKFRLYYSKLMTLKVQGQDRTLYVCGKNIIPFGELISNVIRLIYFTILAHGWFHYISLYEFLKIFYIGFNFGLIVILGFTSRLEKELTEDLMRGALPKILWEMAWLTEGGVRMGIFGLIVKLGFTSRLEKEFNLKTTKLESQVEIYMDLFSIAVFFMKEPTYPGGTDSSPSSPANVEIHDQHHVVRESLKSGLWKQTAH
ncbi:hypothetical protein ACJX0J_029351, partial [Zea mays]